MAEEARLALQQVRINRRRGSLFVYDDRFVVSTETGERTIPLAHLERLSTRRTMRGARLLMMFEDDELIEVRGLDASATTVAHRTIVEIARSLH